MSSIRRRRAAVLAVVATGVVAGALVVRSTGHGSDAPPEVSSATSVPPPRLSSRVVRRALAVPVSGEAVAAANGRLLVIGGLDAAGGSTGDVVSFDPRSGTADGPYALPSPIHDAAAASSAGGVLVLGGGATSSTDAVESLSASGSARSVGSLPAPRSDLAAVSVGRYAYLLGGYGGGPPDPTVLRTTDGRSFEQVADLPVPVRYAAAASSAGVIYVFGGETADGRATSAIQAVDPSAGTVRVVAHLPRPTSHASAVALGGRIYVLGGTVGGGASDQVLSFDPSTRSTTLSGRLPMPVTNSAAAPLGDSAYLVGGRGRSGAPLSSIVRLTPQKAPAASGAATDATTTTTSTGDSAGRAATPFDGHLLIADRGNDRLLLVNSRKRVLWRYPAGGRPAPPGGFYFPDDAFFTHGGRGIIANEEQDERVVQLSFPSGRVTWSYGHPGIAGSSPGYLHEPDDAYLLKDGTVTIADAQNCRVLVIAPDRRVHSIGTAGSCVHDPPHSLASPNGDTPLANGDLLVSEVNGSYVDEFTTSGHLVWSVHLPIAYPSDPQQLGPDRYLVADYTSPGGIYEFNRAGRILWAYHPPSGSGMLDHPSLAERLPNGLIAVNDDYRDRVVLIDPQTRRIVWQYGRTDVPGTGPNRLNTPDGFDLRAPGGATPTHPSTG